MNEKIKIKNFINKNKLIFGLFILSIISSFFISFTLQIFLIAATLGLQFIEGFNTKSLIYISLGIFLGSMIGNGLEYIIFTKEDLYMY